MTDEALECIWERRRSISAKCDYDAHRLVEYMQTHKRKSQSGAPGAAKKVAKAPR